MKNCNRICVNTLAFILLCTLPSCSFIRFAMSSPGDGSGTPVTRAEAQAEGRYIEWCQSLPNYIIPRMCDYYQLHPERFKPTGQGEEIKIEGFADFIKNDSYFKSGTRCFIVNGTIFNPWHEPLRFVQDLNMDGYIEDGGLRRIVLKQSAPGKPEGLNAEHHFGIYKASPFKGPFGQPWERIFAETF